MAGEWSCSAASRHHPHSTRRACAAPRLGRPQDAVISAGRGVMYSFADRVSDRRTGGRSWPISAPCNAVRTPLRHRDRLRVERHHEVVHDERNAWIIGLAALIGCGIAWSLAPRQFPDAWLAAITCFLAWPLGSLARFCYLNALTGGRWGLAICPQLSVASLSPAAVDLGAAAAALRGASLIPVDEPADRRASC